MSIEAHYNLIATLYRKVRQKDNMAGWTESLQAVRHNIRCNMQPLTATEAAYAQSIGSTATHKIFCNYLPEITVEKVLTIENINYDIKAVMNAAGRNHHLEIVVEIRK